VGGLREKSAFGGDCRSGAIVAAVLIVSSKRLLGFQPGVSNHADIPSNVTSMQIKLTAYALTGDGVSVTGSTNRQDFAVFAYNTY
jgi:hypothetical protein